MRSIMTMRGGIARAIYGGLSLLALASCSILGASLDSLTSMTAGGDAGETCVDGKCTPSPSSTDDGGGGCGGTGVVCKEGEVCADGRCGTTCPEGQVACDGTCADLQTDSKNCSVCGNACGANDECVEGKCVIACRTQLHQPLTDPWGWSWDGLERAVSTFSDAQTACSGFRARLPTASELYRVSATQSATVGQTLHKNPLWSLDPAGADGHLRVTLADAKIASEVDTTKLNYRCVCPPPLPKIYTGNNCWGAPRTPPCDTLEGEGKRHNIDTADRAPLEKGQALWECSFYGGHLATALQLAEGVQKNIGPGSGNWLHSADEIRFDQSAVLNWTNGEGFLFESVAADGHNGVTFGATSDVRPFRCVGENATPPPLPQVAGQWAGPGRRRTEVGDRPAATFIDAVDQCFKLGGHLPTMTEMNELVAQGAPGGSGTLLWTSDETGFDGKDFTVAVTKWTGTDPGHSYGDDNMGWAYKTDEKPFRCVYYPADTAYSGPAANACAGGCTLITFPARSGAKSWFDSSDREGATTTVAIDTCRKLGGHLASERDLIEAIRDGLPNGANAFVQSSDSMLGWCGMNRGGYCSIGGACSNVGGPCGFLGFGRCISNGPTCDVALYVGNVKWTKTMATFDDLWENAATSRMDWSKSSDVKPFRCMWTNELR
jgi:hypothetical protein